MNVVIAITLCVEILVAIGIVILWFKIKVPAQDVAAAIRDEFKAGREETFRDRVVPHVTGATHAEYP